jgi:hypothetical protein
VIFDVEEPSRGGGVAPLARDETAVARAKAGGLGAEETAGVGARSPNQSNTADKPPAPPQAHRLQVPRAAGAFRGVTSSP